MTHNIEPLVCIAASLMEVANGRYAAHGTGQTVVRSVSRFANCEPLLLPGVKDYYDCDRLADRLDGRVLRASSVDDGRLEFRDLPEPEAVAAVDTAVVWALASEGTALFRLAAGDPPLEIDLPFVATAIDADPETGQCWVAGAADLAVYSAMGGLIEPQQEFKGGRSMSIRVDAVHGTLWLGGGGRLVKRKMDGTALARLDGFSQSTFLAVDARGGTR